MFQAFIFFPRTQKLV